MKAIQRKATTLPARVAAPLPTADKATLARTIAGTVMRLGSHESRQAGMRRNASVRMNGVAIVAVPVMPDSILCAWECHESFVQTVSIPRQSRWKKPSSARACSDYEQRARTDSSERVGAQRPPEPERERDDQQAGEVRAYPVVDPGTAGGVCPEVGDVVVHAAVGARLREPTDDPADVDGHARQKAADSGDPTAHARLPHAPVSFNNHRASGVQGRASSC